MAKKHEPEPAPEEPKTGEGQQKINKSQAVREVATENPDWKPKQIVEEMARRGIQVSAQQVYQALKAVKGASALKTEPTGAVSHAQVITVLRQLIKESGPEEAKKLIDLLGD